MSRGGFKTQSVALRVAVHLACRAATVVLLAIVWSSNVFAACPQCFGAEETTLVGGTKLGVLVMLGIVLVVQGLFVAFFLYLRKRAKQFADDELDTEWSDLQRASRTS